MSLTDPSKKMSKSDPSAYSRILITDSPAEISAKLRTATTDSINSVSWDPINRPGVANLLTILSAFDKEGRSTVELGMSMGGVGLGAFKKYVGESVAEGLKGIREEFGRLMEDGGGEGGYLSEVAEEGRMMAVESAEGTMVEVKKAMGSWRG